MSKQELIIVKQLPIIEEQLKGLSEEISKKVSKAMKLAVTEETVKEVKKVRAELNADFKELEEKRKAVKNAVMNPYKDFEEIYKKYVSDQYKEADESLKEKIDTVEDQIRDEKEKEVKEYFEEYKNSKDIDFIKYEDARINVTLSASMKSLKDTATEFIDRIESDLKLIDTQEHKTDILVEYKRSLNVSDAITSVSNRMKAIEEEKKRQEELAKQREEAKEMEQKITKVVAPKEEKKEERYTAIFEVTDTKAKLIQLREYLKKEGYEYDQK